MSKITYQTQETPFYKALQTEVEAYFATKNKEKIGNASLYIKGIIIFSLAVYLYVQLVFWGIVGTYWHERYARRLPR